MPKRAPRKTTYEEKSPDERCGAFFVNFKVAGQERMGSRGQGEALLQVRVRRLS